MKNKTRILFVIDALRQGGIRTSLLNLLANLDYSKYDVYLFCFHFIKDDEINIPKEVYIIYPNLLFDIVASTGKELKNNSIIKYCLRIILSLFCKLFGSNLLFDFIFKTEKRDFDFDVAISYTNNVNDHSLYFGSNKFVIEKVNAKKKIAWIHADYEKMNLNTKVNNEEYKFFNQIVCVSSRTANSFLKGNEHLKDRVEIVYNLLNTNIMTKLSNESIKEITDKGKLNIISVIRFDENKDPFFMIEIANKLKKAKVNFCWRILGIGPLFDNTKSKINEYNLEDQVELLGFINNPFPYYKMSDLYISTSYSEGYSMSILEALFFELDIICGRYDSIDEILDDNNGCIIEKNIDEYVDAILSFRYKRKEHLILHSNTEILMKVNKLLAYSGKEN